MTEYLWGFVMSYLFETMSNTELKDLQKTEKQQKWIKPKPSYDGWRTKGNEPIRTLFCLLQYLTVDTSAAPNKVLLVQWFQFLTWSHIPDGIQPGCSANSVSSRIWQGFFTSGKPCFSWPTLGYNPLGLLFGWFLKSEIISMCS